MNRSYRKPYIKDKGKTKHEYWSPIRHTWKQIIHSSLPEEIALPHQKTIINDYDYSDFLIILEKFDKGYKKYSRK